jgi:hypothetical protein
MASADDIFRLDPIIHRIGELLFALTTQELPKGRIWTTSLLDVRFDESGGFSDKIRVTCKNAEVVSLSMPTELTLQLIELGNARPKGQDRWYGFKFEVTSAGSCQVDLNYDPACANDPDFFAS